MTTTTINRQALLDALKFMRHVSSYVRLDVEENSLQLTAFNDQVIARRTVEATTAPVRPEATAINPSRLTRLLKHLTDSEIVLQLTDAGLRVATLDDRLRFTVLTRSLERTIQLTPITSEQPITLPAALLADLRRRVLPAVAEDNLRPVLQHILMRCDGFKLTCVAADGFRMTKLDAPFSQRFEALVPGDVLRLAKHIAEDGLLLSEPEGAVQLHFSNTILSSWRSSGQSGQIAYPDYKRILSKVSAEPDTRAWVNRADLLSALRIARALGEDRAAFEVGDSLSMNSDYFKAAVAVSEKEGDSCRFSMALSFMADAIKTLAGEYIIIDIHKDDHDATELERMRLTARPGYIVFRSDDDDNYQHLVMPTTER